MHSDEQLIKKIKRRSDREAAGELLQRYYRDIYAFIFRQVSHRETAMDLTQDTFIAVLRGLPSFYSLVLLRSLVHGRKSGDEFSGGRGSRCVCSDPAGGSCQFSRISAISETRHHMSLAK